MHGRDGEQQNLCMVNGCPTCNIVVDDRGFEYGDGIFESMLYEQGRIPLLKYHLRRVKQGAKRLAIDFETEILSRHLNTFIRGVKSTAVARAKLKLTLTRGVGGDGGYAPSGSEHRAGIVLRVVGEISSAEPRPVELVVATSPLPTSPVLAGIKHLNRLPYIAAALNCSRTQGQEVLYLDEQHNIVETMHHNIFFFKDNRLVSPSLQRCGVEGIARRIVFEQLAAEIGLQVVEDSIHIDEAHGYDECFLTNAVRGIIAVKKLGAHEYAGAEVGESLNGAFKEFKANL